MPPDWSVLGVLSAAAGHGKVLLRDVYSVKDDMFGVLSQLLHSALQPGLPIEVFAGASKDGGPPPPRSE